MTRSRSWAKLQGPQSEAERKVEMALPESHEWKVNSVPLKENRIAEKLVDLEEQGFEIFSIIPGETVGLHPTRQILIVARRRRGPQNES